MKTTYFSDWVKLYDIRNKVVAKVLLKNQFVRKSDQPINKQKKVSFMREQDSISQEE